MELDQRQWAIDSDLVNEHESGPTRRVATLKSLSTSNLERRQPWQRVTDALPSWEIIIDNQLEESIACNSEPARGRESLFYFWRNHGWLLTKQHNPSFERAKLLYISKGHGSGTKPSRGKFSYVLPGSGARKYFNNVVSGANIRLEEGNKTSRWEGQWTSWGGNQDLKRIFKEGKKATRTNRESLTGTGSSRKGNSSLKSKLQ